MKQKDVANIIGTSSNYYGDYENGKREIPLSRMIILAEYYGVSLDYIAGRTNDKKGLTRSELSERESDIIKKIRSLNDERRGEIIGALNILYKQQASENALHKEAK